MTETVQTPATPVATGTPEIRTMLAAAVQGVTSAKESAVAAAKLADKSDCVDLEPSKRLDAILALYADIFPSNDSTIKTAFSAALAILVADKGVLVEYTVVNKNGNAVIGSTPAVVNPSENPEKKANSPEQIAALQANPPKEATTFVRELTPEQAVDLLNSNTMKNAGKVAREAIGKARAAGGGRKAATPEVPKAKPFLELVGDAMRDPLERAKVFSVIVTAAKVDTELRLYMAEQLRNLGFTVEAPKSRAPAPAKS